MTSTTFEEQVKKLDDILQKFREIIPDSDGKQNGENLHYFGPCNVEEEQEIVNETIGKLKSSYEKFRSVNNVATVAKLINDKKSLIDLSKPLKKCLKEATAKLKDTTLKTTIQKLEAITLQEGLRFDCEQMNNCFISSDMFYIEVILDSLGLAEDVKIHGHTGEPKSCKEMINILRRKDYEDFVLHLKGLKRRYMLKGDAITKSNILTSLEVLEDDVLKIQRSDMSASMVTDCISHGPVGYVIPRVGGKSLQMTYCVNPFSLLDIKHEGMDKVFCNEDPVPRSLGYSSLMTVQQAAKTFLPLTSLVTYENKSLKYLKQDLSNSQELPATFVLNLSKPLPTSVYVAKALYKILMAGHTFVHNSTINLDALIVEQHTGKRWTQIDREPFMIALPDQAHIFRCIVNESSDNRGILLSSIPFNQPSQIPQIIKLLRCQAKYNLLLSSCLNKNGDIKDLKKFIFDVSAADWNIINVAFTHPISKMMASVDFKVLPDANIECTLNVAPGSPVFCKSAYLNKIVNRCLSLPVTMRSLIKKSDSYKPELESMKVEKKDKTRIKSMKLLMPSLAQIQSGLPMMSPQLTSSPSTFLNFSATGISSGGQLFTSDKSKSSRKRIASITTPVSTPGSESSSGTPVTPSKLKLKLKIKRKRNVDSEIYEIDQPKTELDMEEQPTSADSLSFISQFDNENTLKTSSQSLFPNSSNFPDLPLEGETDIAGLLGIPSEPFVQGDLGFSVSSHVPAFDLDALTSGEDMNLISMTTAAIDPSALTTQTSFDIDADGIIDIDKLMNVGP